VSEVVDVEITAPDADWLAEFTRRLVEDRLVASGNISAVRSIYRWNDAIEDRPEARVVLHTHRSRVPEIMDRTLAEHPYAVPGLRVIEVNTHPAYAAWLIDSTGGT